MDKVGGNETMIIIQVKAIADEKKMYTLARFAEFNHTDGITKKYRDRRGGYLIDHKRKPTITFVLK